MGERLNRGNGNGAQQAASSSDVYEGEDAGNILKLAIIDSMRRRGVTHVDDSEHLGVDVHDSDAISILYEHLSQE